MGNVAVKSGIRSVIEDLSPQLGADLDVNGFTLGDGSGAVTIDGTDNRLARGSTDELRHTLGTFYPMVSSFDLGRTSDPFDATYTTTIELGHAADTTLARVAAGVVSVQGNNVPTITTGAGAPSSTPTIEGEIYVDTTGDNAYVAAGTASSADWKQATGAGGGDLLAANNLSDVAVAATALSNLGGIGAATSDTLTNKTFDANGTGNSISNIETADAASSAKSGLDTTFVTGTKGTSGQVGEWNADGDLVGVSTYAKIQRYRTIYIDAGAMLAPTTSPATTGTNEYTTNDLDFDYFAFATGADSFVQWKMVMPDDWDRSTIKAKFLWSTATATTTADSITWGIQAVALGDSDAIDAAWGAAVTREDAVLADNGADMQISPASNAITVGGSPAGVGEMVAFRVYRDVSADTIPEDIWLFGVQIQYQTLTTEPAAW